MGIQVRLLVSFSGLIFLVGLAGVAGWHSTVKLAREMLEIGSDNVQGAVELAKAETALWQLRYGVPQLLALGPAEGAHIPAEQSKWFAQIEGAIAAYSRGNRTPEERSALERWRDLSSRYFAARPRWFELVKAGRLGEAAEWHASQTTPLGAGAVEALNRLIELQQVTAKERIAYATSSAEKTRSLLLGLMLGAVALAMILGALNTRAIASPMRAMARHFNEMSEGKWDLSRRISPPPLRELGEMAARFNRLIEQMAGVIAEVSADASAVAAAAAHVLSASQSVARGANQQWSSAKEVASRLLEIDESIGKNAEACGLMEESARKAVKSAEESRATITAAMTAVKEIAGQAATVEELATQTSILSVNATIEASTAAASAKRFGALAGEVRRLAERSRDVSRGISSIASASVEAAERSTRVLTVLVPSIHVTAGLVESVTRASAAQATTIAEVSQAMTQMNMATERSAESAAELSETAMEMSSRADGLQRLVSVFKW